MEGAVLLAVKVPSALVVTGCAATAPVPSNVIVAFEIPAPLSSALNFPVMVAWVPQATLGMLLRVKTAGCTGPDTGSEKGAGVTPDMNEKVNPLVSTAAIRSFIV